MAIIQQTIQYDKNVPARIRLVDKQSSEPHRHSETELIYVDKGSLQATIDYQDREYIAGDVIVISSNAVHSLRGENARILSVHLSYVFV